MKKLQLSRRRLLRLMLGTTAMAAGPLAMIASRAATSDAAAAPARTIDVVAQRFLFRPSEIPLKAGERVVLAIRSLDFIHGFHVPALNLRTDLMPGQVTHVEIQIPEPGQYDFQCDNFCGDGHENMHGHFAVSA